MANKLQKKDILAYLSVLNSGKAIQNLTLKEKAIAFNPVNLTGCFSRLMQSIEEELDESDDFNPQGLRDVYTSIQNREYFNAVVNLEVNDPYLERITEETSLLLLGYLRNKQQITSEEIKQEFISKCESRFAEILGKL